MNHSFKRKVLILISDEREHYSLVGFEEVDLIFRRYSGKKNNDPRIRPFPVPYMNAVANTNPKPFESREVNVFFSGYLNRNRVDLYKQFCPQWWLPKKNLPGKYAKELARRSVEKFCRERNFDRAIKGGKIAFTEWFGKGLPPMAYAETLANTKIAICPPGFVSHETIRHSEAMKMGCIIITAPLPETFFYSGSPMITLNDWSDLRTTLNNLLSNPDRMLELHHNTREWWHKIYSEEAMAAYVATQLANL
jgi:hypothetical protein